MKPSVKQADELLSVIIPTLNEECSIGSTLKAVAQMRSRVEVIVVDGGSRDATVEIARESGAHVITAQSGRGSQLHIGASVAQGTGLWFLHADTHPPVDAAERIFEVLKNPNIIGGNFTVKFDGTHRAARFLTWLYPQLRRLGLIYGDSAIFVRRELYEAVGGFRPFPIFEDLDLIRRLKRHGRMVHLPITVVTSSRRFEGRSFVVTFARWAALQALYWIGVHPRILGQLYAPIRGRDR